MRPLLPALSVLVLTAGCRLDNTLNKSDKDGDGFDTGNGNPFETGEDSDPPPPKEECNGVDDDEDGEIDEGFPDEDGNGRVDCLDQECPPLDVATEEAVEVLPECKGSGGGEIDDPWNVSLEYRFTVPNGTVVMPSVGNLTDDNGDGVVDDGDIPDIAFTSWAGGLYVVSGDGSGEIFSFSSGYQSDGGVVIADVDADGEPEVAAIVAGGRIRVLDRTGATEWTSGRAYSLLYPVMTVADLDEDGMPEIVADAGIVRGDDGSDVAQLSVGNTYWRSPIAADIDQDGDQEVILSDGVYDSDGTLLWNAGTMAGTIACFAAVANIDSDDNAELFFTCGQEVGVYEDDGTEIRTFGAANPYGHPGPPCMADFDGDGQVELGVPGGSTLYLFEVDGTKVWESPINDSSGAAGCSGYDVNGDGAYEMLFADQDALRIYDGPTGEVVYENNDHGSVTYFEYPVVADVDADGSAEMIVAASSGVLGVSVYGHNGDGWPQSGPTWPVHDFGVTNVDPDGHVPDDPEATWLRHNVFRARPSVDNPSFADLYVQFDDVCVMDCTYGPAELSLHVANRGAADVRAGTLLSLYADEDMGPRLIQTWTLPAIAAGTSLEGLTWEVPVGDIGHFGFIARVDDDGTGVGEVDECDEDNNEDRYTDVPC